MHLKKKGNMKGAVLSFRSGFPVCYDGRKEEGTERRSTGWGFFFLER